MKTKLRTIFFGNDWRLSGLIAFSIIALVALGCTCGKNFDLANLAKNSNTATTSDETDAGEMPDDQLLNALVKETTADFAYAISTEDFSKLYEKSSRDFQATYTEDQMKDVFKSFIEKKRVILPLLAKVSSMEPEYSPEPSIRTEKGLSILVTNGKFSTKPVPLNFEYEYVKRDGKWKIVKLVIKLI